MPVPWDIWYQKKWEKDCGAALYRCVLSSCQLPAWEFCRSFGTYIPTGILYDVSDSLFNLISKAHFLLLLDSFF